MLIIIISESDGDKTADDSQTFDEDSEKDNHDGPDSMIVTDELGEEEADNSENAVSSSQSGNVASQGKESEQVVMSSTVSNSESKSAEPDKGADSNTVDNEDSINLEIGDEEKLLAEEEVNWFFGFLFEAGVDLIF